MVGRVKLYLRADVLAMVSITTEEIHTLVIDAVSGKDRAIDLDGEADIRAGNLDR